jgi:hypothetical protein
MLISFIDILLYFNGVLKQCKSNNNILNYSSFSRFIFLDLFLSPICLRK